jgi:hypothetical protein
MAQLGTPFPAQEASMTTNRREFIERLGATAMLGALPLSGIAPTLDEFVQPSGMSLEDFDFSWFKKVQAKKYKAVFDCAEVDSGYGVWRAVMWEDQYHSSFGLKAEDTTTVLVIRHAALVLGFNQDFWDKYGIGAQDKVTHPITQQSTDRNPALLSSTRNEVPAMFDAFALPNFIARGGTVLACNVALQFFSAGLAKKANMSEDEARKAAIAAFLPGVTLQPSGVFAAVRAQDAGCRYVRAS